MKRIFLILTVIGQPWVAFADLIRVEYEAEVRTVTGSPFGGVAPAGTSVTGWFVYDTGVPDTYVISTPTFGEYAHAGTGEFEAVFPGLTITGSGSLTVTINDSSFSDTFAIIDGDRDVGPEGGTMSVNGVPDEEVELNLSITADGDTFTSDALPDPFPLASAESPYPNPNTFTLSDDDGILSLQLIRLRLPRTGVPVESVSYSGVNETVTLTWLFEAGNQYAVEFSTDLVEWTEIASGVTAGQFTDMLSARFAPDAPPLAGFYRVFE